MFLDDILVSLFYICVIFAWNTIRVVRCNKMSSDTLIVTLSKLIIIFLHLSCLTTMYKIQL